MAGSDSESGLRERLRSSTSVLASRGLGVTQMSHAEILSLNLTEKDELISGLRQLYDSSGKAEQVRLLTIAPSNWGRYKVQRFFNSPERQARPWE